MNLPLLSVTPPAINIESFVCNTTFANSTASFSETTFPRIVASPTLSRTRLSAPATPFANAIAAVASGVRLVTRRSDNFTKVLRVLKQKRYEVSPLLHENAPLLQSIRTSVGRLGLVVQRVCQRELDHLDAHTSFLASVGSVSPYVGLFGTVWGIMHAFRGLANVGQATLANVAPGIAEALVATAIGLFAAIPAVVAYNHFAHDIDKLANRFDTFMEEFSNILQRQAAR